MNVNFGLFPPLDAPPTRTPRANGCAARPRPGAKKRAVPARARRSRALDRRHRLCRRRRISRPTHKRTWPCRDFAGRWRSEVVLKRDVFSPSSAAHFKTAKGEVEAMLRRIDDGALVVAPAGPPSVRARSPHLAASAGRHRAAAALRRPRHLVRGFIKGVALHIAKPHGDTGYFRSAKPRCASCTAPASVITILPRSRTGCAAATGAPTSPISSLPRVFARRSKLFRIAAYEDLRHLLKHKRRYAPDALTPTEKRVLARKSLPTRIWMSTVKQALLRRHPRPVQFFRPRRRRQPSRQGRAAYRRAPQATSAGARRRGRRLSGSPRRHRPLCLCRGQRSQRAQPARSLKGGGNIAPPERLQLVDAFPRRASGEIRTEILQLVAMNQIDLIDPLIASETERGLVACIIAGRRNLRDRTAF